MSDASSSTFTPVPLDKSKRTWLIASTCAGAAGAAALATPFVSSFAPSEKAKAAGAAVEVDIASLKPGEKTTVEWRGKPVWLMRRTEDMVRALQATDNRLADPLSKRSVQPASCANANRSERPELFVAIGVCTHLGCSPRLTLDDPALRAELHAPGGFFCPCHGSRFDLAGRVVKNVPAPTNLDIPDYRFTSATALRIG